jgi:hypothetical protein
MESTKTSASLYLHCFIASNSVGIFCVHPVGEKDNKRGYVLWTTVKCWLRTSTHTHSSNWMLWMADLVKQVDEVKKLVQRYCTSFANRGHTIIDLKVSPTQFYLVRLQNYINLSQSYEEIVLWYDYIVCCVVTAWQTCFRGNGYTRNKEGTVESDVFYAIHAKATKHG